MAAAEERDGVKLTNLDDVRVAAMHEGKRRARRQRAEPSEPG